MNAFSPPSQDKAALEEGSAFTPRFDSNGLITAIVTDSRDGALLMVAHMNAEALQLSLDTGVAHYLQTIVELRTDCDQDALWLKVNVAGDDVTCHTGRRSCFYRVVGDEKSGWKLQKD
jgi:phosphoribosyl-AMP cyclohydrolase